MRRPQAQTIMPREDVVRRVAGWALSSFPSREPHLVCRSTQRAPNDWPARCGRPSIAGRADYRSSQGCPAARSAARCQMSKYCPPPGEIAVPTGTLCVMTPVAQGGNVKQYSGGEGGASDEGHGVLDAAQRRPSPDGEEQSAAPHHPGRMHRWQGAIGQGRRPRDGQRTACQRPGRHGQRQGVQGAVRMQIAGMADRVAGVASAPLRARSRRVRVHRRRRGSGPVARCIHRGRCCGRLRGLPGCRARRSGRGRRPPRRRRPACR